MQKKKIAVSHQWSAVSRKENEMSTVKSYADYAREQLGVQDGTKLSTYQKQKNRAEYQKYVNNALAEQQKNEQLAQINKNKTSSLRESEIASERARQYIDAVNKHLGIAGTGYAQSKAIDLYAQEAQRRAEINNNHSTQQSEILKAYQDAVAQNELTASEQIGNIELAEDQETESKRQNYITTLQSVLEQQKNGEITDEAFSKYYTEYAKYLGEDDTILKSDLEAEATRINGEQEFFDAYGFKPEDAVSLDELINNEEALGSFAKGEKQTQLINSIIQAARSKGSDSLEGKIINANYGLGTPHYYIYKNGYFYKISKEQAVEIIGDSSKNKKDTSTGGYVIPNFKLTDN